ncbi:RHS repeat-associated core domain-containing protein [Streptomyces sp. NPDC006655]|uniref:RHS repeat-associated core domain-containing protein n=1 Tax=Streptomyces sp. NPDC006655 TaxID=3156898 RepID=UPI00345492C5
MTAAYDYNGIGATTTRPNGTDTQSLTWNAAGSLDTVTVKSSSGTTKSTTSHVYDADGNLLIRRNTSGETVLYLGTTEVHLDTSTSTAKYWAQRYYSVGSTTIALRTNKSGSQTLSYLAGDPHGTSTLSLDATTQAVTKRYETPFGAARSGGTGVWADDKTFLGKSTDSTSGLTYIGAREYDSTTGRFLSVDPLLDTNNAQSLNGYAYAGNNPSTFSDPSGMRFCADDACRGDWVDSQGGYHDVDGNNAGGDYCDRHRCYEGSGTASTSSTGHTSGTGSSAGNSGGCAPLVGCGVAAGPLIGPQPEYLPYIPPGIAAPGYAEKRECAAMQILVSCNPGDAILGGGNDDLREIGLKWGAGSLDGATTYGEDSEVAKQVMVSDVTAAQRKEIMRKWSRGQTEGTLEPYSIGAMSTQGKIKQFLTDGWSLMSGGRNASLAVLGSYTAKYKILRANRNGVQARITITNNMTMSSFAHIATGYGTAADRAVQRYDNDGIVAFFGAATSHYMTITFRTVIMN